MKTRRPNYRLVKIHRSYTVEQIASLFGIHKHTVRNWMKKGLTTSDLKRPVLILGAVLSAFLKAKRLKNKQPCKPGEIFCLRCRLPRNPAGEMAEYQPTSATLGCLIGICPACGKFIYRRVNPTKLEQIRGKMNITFPIAQKHIVERTEPFVNTDLEQGEENHANTQPN